ncbi:NAD(P)/FAD-dependent oxidoreductase [Salisediminibacterium selenitireducens]|uniref:FAD dependent oxidoreductase n=1 Tax=Bacillus selenitireducens (strain ATCC 700615 / DSM 15326 / MLS10) TaxID=439292 RepID=D6XUK5_BACIE|nr:FAD-dependent oxidoreductase [Salisediminibacterium selenitireducens]ADH99491.1 FAD dependent oxidoreductase [[Bacillus] selenitireducens MLS10]
MSDYIIIGGGIVGASAAYHLSKTGAKVTVIDKGVKGQATDAAAGIICPWLSKRRNKAWYNIVKEGAAYYHTLIPELEELTDLNTGYVNNGTIAIDTEWSKLEEKFNRAITRREEAPEIGDIQYLDEQEVQSMFPLAANLYRGVYVSGGARVDGRKLRDALIMGAVKLGAVHIRGDATVTPTGDHRFIVRTGYDEKETPNVIMTPGAWANSVFKGKRLNMNLRPQKGQILHVKLHGIKNDHWPVVLPPNDYYVLPFEDGRMVIGATREENKHFDTTVTMGGMHEILSRVLPFAPGFQDAEILEMRTGIRPFAGNSVPVFGEFPELPGLYTANGLGSSGLTSGPFVGAELARMGLKQETTLKPRDYDISELMK